VGVGAAAFAPSKIFSFLVNASGALILVVYLMVCLAYLRICHAEATTEKTIQGRGRFRPFPAATAVTMVGIVAVLIAMATTPGLSSQFYASAVPLVIISAGYWAVKRSRR
jgi:L-asparagine transporter-like permease